MTEHPTDPMTPERWRAAALDAQMTCSGLREALQQEMDRAHKAEAEVERLREQSAWQPIETAPKSEWPVVVLTERGTVYIACWTPLDGDDSTSEGWWRVAHTVGQEITPTYWMPLPEAPEGKNDE